MFVDREDTRGKSLYHVVWIERRHVLTCLKRYSGRWLVHCSCAYLPRQRLANIFLLINRNGSRLGCVTMAPSLLASAMSLVPVAAFSELYDENPKPSTATAMWLKPASNRPPPWSVLDLR